MKLIIAFTIIGAILIFGGIVYLLLTDKAESEVSDADSN